MHDMMDVMILIYSRSVPHVTAVYSTVVALVGSCCLHVTVSDVKYKWCWRILSRILTVHCKMKSSVWCHAPHTFSRGWAWPSKILLPIQYIIQSFMLYPASYIYQSHISIRGLWTGILLLGNIPPKLGRYVHAVQPFH